MLSSVSIKRRSLAVRPLKVYVSHGLCSEADQIREGRRGGEKSYQNHNVFEEGRD